jgi:hypothetical protein
LRRRVFVIGARDGSPFYFPKTTHHNKGESEAAHRSAWDALQDLTSSVTSDTRPKGKWADLLPTIPAGMNYLWHTDRGSGEPLFGRGWRRSACGPFSLETVRVRPPYPSRVSMLSLRGRIAPRFFWTQVRGRRLASAPKATEKTCDA